MSASDVAIVGGGVMGCSAAYFLRLHGLSATVVEADPTYARASSALSASSIRQQFSTPVCLQMSRYGFAFLKEVDAHLGLQDEPADQPSREGCASAQRSTGKHPIDAAADAHGHHQGDHWNR